VDKLWITFFPLIQKINYWGKRKNMYRCVDAGKQYWGRKEKKSVDLPVRYYWGVIRFYPRKLFLDDQIQGSLLCNTPV
jgi:hypothetical protein